MNFTPRILFACASLSLFTASLAAQEVVGGKQRVQFEFGESLRYVNLGSSVATLGDLNGDGVAELLVGAPSYNVVGGNRTGAAFLYSGQTGELLHRFDGEVAHGGFGRQVANAGDVNGDGIVDLLIAAPEAEDANDVQQVGILEVYSGATLKRLYRIVGTQSLGRLGSSIAGLGDMDGDGFSDFLAGQPGVFFGSDGAAFVYSGATGQVMRSYGPTSPGAQTGFDVANAGDVDADGTPDYIVGSPYYLVTGPYSFSGLVQVYSGATGALLLEMDGNQTAHTVGRDVSGAGDVNADGFDDILLGFQESSEGFTVATGEYMVLSGADGSLLHHGEGERDFGMLGSEVAAAGDVDQDGYDDFMVAAEGMHAVFIYSGRTGMALTRLQSENPASLFGSAMTSAGDLDGDGYPEFLIGANRDRGSAGTAFLIGFHPLLQSDTISMSAALGGTVQFTLDFPQKAAQFEYQVLLSTRLGPIYRGVGIPLGDGKMMRDSKRGWYHFGTDVNMTGALDASGNASASMIFAPGEIPALLVGHTFYAAAVAAPTLGWNVDYSSVAVPLTITP